MAGSSQDKTEKPSSKRLDKARREGNFVVSREFIAAAQYITFIAMAGAWRAAIFNITDAG